MPINTSADLLAAAVETFVENNPGYPWSGVSWSESDSDAATAARKAIGTLGVPTTTGPTTPVTTWSTMVRHTDPAPSPTTDLTGLYACIMSLMWWNTTLGYRARGWSAVTIVPGLWRRRCVRWSATIDNWL